MVKKVLLFGDIGIDDIITLIYAALDEEIEVVAVVASYGNISREKATNTISYIQDLLNYKDLQVPLILGAQRPMTGEIPKEVSDIHGEYGMGPIIPPINDAEVVENFLQIIDIIEKYEDIYIANIGRLTDLATLFILYEDLMGKVKGIYIMGGAFWVPGNITAVAEANFHGDPVAAQLVMRFATNLTILPLNVSNQAIVTPEMVNYIDQVGQISIVKPMIDYYYDFYKKRDPSIMGSPMHDVLVLMAIKNKDMFQFFSRPIMIVQSLLGEERGQSIADIRPYEDEYYAITETNNHQIAFQMEYQQFFFDFMTIMSSGQFDRSLYKNEK
ncbi:nucleoside hydrolase [Oceanobacillus sp. E9]|uniref:nucleoside hydrolase n=1 Tax=Oceanobacillus sp. E9 TaxID=1742575 RepID=UPI00084EBD29|nr:nucleoside hydrolase [Oceanobacillus sp. E9]OEH55224.1 nucleoside hydrolase [Oceanobacillus sp. E9]